MKTRSASGRFAFTVATWFGLGLIPIAPGTWGSLGAVVIGVCLTQFAGWPPWAIGLLGVGFAPVAIWAADVTAKQVRREDPGLVVADEVVGQWIAFSCAAQATLRNWLLAFIFFRIFDIWKPFPVRRLERLPGGWGIVADDIGAGIYAALVLLVMGWFNF